MAWYSPYHTRNVVVVDAYKTDWSAIAYRNDWSFGVFGGIVCSGGRSVLQMLRFLLYGYHTGKRYHAVVVVRRAGYV